MLADAVEWLGHSGFRIRAGRSLIYIDPYRVDDGPPADLILVTHDHYDHFSPQDVERLTGEATTLIAPPAVVERASGRVHAIAPGESIEPDGIRGVEARAIAAYNTSKRDASGAVFHPREAGGVGYELRVGGERLYHSGDTDVIPEMDQVAGVDVALLAVRGRRGRASNSAQGGRSDALGRAHRDARGRRGVRGASGRRAGGS